MKQRVNNQLPNNLPQLQNCIKRDPGGYKEEFSQQHVHYKSLLEIFQFNPSNNDKNFQELVTFLAHICSCYPEELATFPSELVNLLKLYATNLNQEVRMTLVRALILLRNKNLLSAVDLMTLFFELLRCQDKALRAFLKNHIITDMKNVNAKHKNQKVNTSSQNFMFSMLKDSNGIAAKISLDIMIELYNKNVWKDAKTVNVISTACFSKIPKIMATALKFFLGKDEEAEDGGGGDSDSDSDDDAGGHNMPSATEVALANRFNKKTRKRKKLLERTKKVVKKYKKKSHAVESFNFSAIHLLNDPQTLAENLFRLLEGGFNERFELKLLLLNVVSRLIGIHQLLVLNFYPYLQRYLHPKQLQVTKLLQYAAQAAHELVPPENVEPLVKLIANHFVTERNSNEVMAVGVNAIREICARCPLAINEDLLQDLAAYAAFRDKNVSMAAKSLVQLYRVVNPTLLRRKDRGRPTEATAEQRVYAYAESKALSYIAGAEVLVNKKKKEKEKAEKAVKNGEGGEEDEEEEDEEAEDETDDEEEEEKEEEEDGSDSEGWVDVSQSEDEMELEKAGKEGEEEEQHLTAEEALEKARLISSERILTQEEFQRVKLAQLSKQVRAAKPRRFAKSPSSSASNSQRPGEPDVLPSLQTKEIVSLGAIERLYRRSKADKVARLESVRSGREEGVKFGGRKGKLNEHASRSKREQTKTKAYMMIKHKVGRKKKKSFREKQVSLRNALVKRCKTA